MCIQSISVDKTIILGELAKMMVALHVLTTVTSNMICLFTITFSKSPLIRNSIKVFYTLWGARCSLVVRVFAHGVMGHRIDPSWGEPIELFLVPASDPRLV